MVIVYSRTSHLFFLTFHYRWMFRHTYIIYVHKSTIAYNRSSLLEWCNNIEWYLAKVWHCVVPSVLARPWEADHEAGSRQRSIPQVPAQVLYSRSRPPWRRIHTVCLLDISVCCIIMVLSHCLTIIWFASWCKFVCCIIALLTNQSVPRICELHS